MAFRPYLAFAGNAREAFTRYQEIFGGDDMGGNYTGKTDGICTDRFGIAWMVMVDMPAPEG